MTSLAEALGFAPDAKLLIISCDDLGVSYATNSAIYDSLRTGVATSAGLVVPGPWAREAAASYRGEDVGAHLTLNAEYDLYRWGPVTHAPSLLDGDGGFPRTVVDLWEHADVDEVRKECRAQVERAIYWGFDVSHISAHLGAMELRPEFFDVALELAVDFRLPLRLPGADQQHQAGFPFRQLSAEEGVLSPDRLVRPPRGQSGRSAMDQVLGELAPGVTELVLRPARDSEELRAVAPDWAARVEDHAIAKATGYVQVLAGRTGTTLTSYRALRDLQRVPKSS
ncbi:MAG TPA: ChbG/HpnK family deacetylase [Acidimicrobiales bacterium]|nr:ChbG/HpnK family deacetylase [Acidimicrobiales bacterium]